MRRAHEQEGATLSAHRRDGQPADGSRWRELSCHIIGMKDALDLVETTLAGEPLNAETTRKIGGYVRFGLGKDKP
jgi:hypothetical protein